MMADKESAKRVLEEVEAEEAKIKSKLAKLADEKKRHQAAYVKELVAEAGALAEDIFGDLFKGAWSQKYNRLRELSGEILKLDPQSHNRLTSNGDLYGLEEGGDGIRFYSKFVFVPLTNSKPLTDILNRCEKHPDNPYLVRPNP